MGNSRQYYTDCFIEGTTDFIFGEATVVFSHCEIRSLINSYLTAARKVFLGRPWRPYARTVYLRTEMGGQIAPAGWDNWRNPENEKTADYAEYESKGEGARAAAMVAWSRQLTDRDARQYTAEAVLGEWVKPFE